MSEELNDELESQNQPEVEETIPEEESPETPSEDIETLKEQNKKLFERAKTAEAKLKDLKPKVEPKPKESEPAPQGSELNPGDIVALSKLNEDDVDEVIALAKFKGKSVKDVLKDSYTQAWIKTREEERKTAAATSVGTAKRPSTKTTGESLLEKAETTGELPDSDDDLKKVVAARFAAKKNKPVE